MEHPDSIVTFPLHDGIGQPVHYVVTDTSDESVVSAMGANTSQKLAGAADTTGVEKVSVNAHGTVVWSATVKSIPALAFAGSRADAVD